MKMTIRWNRLCSRTLFLSLAGAFCLEAIDIGWAQDETSEAAVAAPRAGNLLDLRGDLPNPRQIDVSALDKLPRVSVSTSDPRQAGKQIVYSGTPLLEALKAGGLVFDSGMAGLRDAVKMTVIVEAADGYQAAFSMAELDPEFTDRVILLGISRTAKRFHRARDLSALLSPARNGRRAGCAKSNR